MLMRYILGAMAALSVGMMLRADPPRLESAQGPLPARAWGRLGTTQFRHGGVIGDVAYSPNSKMLATVGADHSVRAWDSATGKQLWAVLGKPGAFRCLAFSPDGKSLAVGGLDGRLLFLDPANRKELRNLSRHNKHHQAVLFAPNGKHLATVCIEDVVRLIDVDSGKEVDQRERRNPFGGIADYGLPLAFSSDSTILAVAEAAGVRLWDVGANKERLAVALDKTDVAFAVAFAPNDRSFAVGCGDGNLRLFDTATGRLLHTLEGDSGPVCSVAFSADGKTLACGCGSRNAGKLHSALRIWDLATKKPKQEIRGHGPYFSLVRTAPDGKTLAWTGFGNALRVFHLDGLKELPLPAGHWSSVTGLAFADQGRTLITSSGDRTVRFWDVALQKERKRLDFSRSVQTMAVSADGKWLALALADMPEVEILDARTGVETRRLDAKPGGAWCLAFSPDGTSLAGSGLSMGVRAWKVDTGKEQCRFHGPKDHVFGLAFAPDGKTLAASVWDPSGTIFFWDARTAEEKLRRTRGNMTGRVAYSSDGKRFAAAGHGGDVTVWDVGPWTERLMLPGDENHVHVLAFSRDNRWLASGGFDNTIQIWDLATGKERLRLRGHRGPAHAAAFSPDGKTLATAGADTAILLWDISPRP